MARGKKPRELAGQKFGQLTAIERVGHKGKRILWKCVCDCGREKITVGEYLTSERVRSCGCLRDVETVKLKNGSQSTYKSCAYILFKDYKRNAEQRGRQFSLSFSDFIEITSSDCHYCKISPCKETKKTKKGEAYRYNGIDRKDNSIGYVYSNSIPCCSKCNYAKQDTDYEDFCAWLNRFKGI